MRAVTRALETWLANGCEQIGEIRIRKVPEGFDLRHFADATRTVEELKIIDASEARAVASFDAHGEFRPLKTVPNLRRGWSLLVPDVSELRRVLDIFYPAMTGVLASHERGELVPVPLRDTLARQTGMYAVTRRIGDEEADALAGMFCESGAGCLKTILWEIRGGRPVTSLPPTKFDLSENQTGAAVRALPMLCHEACNLFVSKARELVRKKRENG